MTTWIVGDVHGCARELELLLERLALGREDRLVSCGDLFHRGPDPAGVAELLAAAGARFVLGNHERAVLRRMGLAPRLVDGSDRPPLRAELPDLDSEDLAGDGGAACAVEPKRRAALVRFLQGHSGYLVRGSALAGAGPTRDGRDWVVVHAGIDPHVGPEQSSVDCLTSVRRLAGRGRPWWYEAWRGPELVLFGHTPSPVPRAHFAGGALVALGLDTGCVYGGSLTAYSPELDRHVAIPAARAQAA
jgi:serine/threonine protein phosphatase 1